MLAASGQVIFERLGVIENHFRVRDRCDGIERQRKRLAREIWHHPEPLEKRRAISQKTRRREAVIETLALEINGSEGERVGNRESGLFQALALPSLRRRIIAPEHPEPPADVRIAQRERVRPAPNTTT